MGKFGGIVRGGALRASFYLSTIAATTTFLVAAPAMAQVVVDIAVRDAESGESITGVGVKIENLETGISFEAVSNPQGSVRFGGLSTGGRWQVSTDGGDGYQSARSEPIILRSNFERSITLLLQSAGSVETIIVTGSQVISGINRTNAEVSGTFTAEDLQRIPIEGRSLDNLLFRLPNVSQATGFFSEAPQISINGANSLFTNFTVDGLDNNENFLGGIKFPVPIGAIQDVTVLASGYSVEYGRTANGIVNVTTKSGTNDLTGEVFLVKRPGDFLTSSIGDFNPRSSSGNVASQSFERTQFGFGVGGPIVKDKTFFFLNWEYTKDDTNNQLGVPQLGTSTILNGENEQQLITAKIDHHWDFLPGLVSTLRINRGNADFERPGGGVDGGSSFPSTANKETRNSLNAAFTTSYAADTWDYSGAIQYSRFAWNFGLPLDGVQGQQATIVSTDGQVVGTVGGPGFLFDEREATVQSQHKLNVNIGRHNLKFGVDFITRDIKLIGGGNPSGNFRVELTDAQLTTLAESGIDVATFDVGDLPADATVLNANFEIQNGIFQKTQNTYDLWAEDQIQLTPDLTASLGVRWMYDNLSKGGGSSGDFDNFAPRANVNWTFRDDMVLRGGVGLFYEKIPEAIWSDALQFSGNGPGLLAQIQTLIDKGILPANTNIDRITGPGQGSVDIADLCTGLSGCPDPSSVRDRIDQLTSGDLRILNPNGFDNPYALQFSIGWQWQVDNLWRVTVDGILNEGRNLFRLRDLNSADPFTFNQAAFDQLGEAGVAALTPAEREALGLIRSGEAANATRPALNPDGSIPAGGARSITVSESKGRSRYKAIVFTLEKGRGDDIYGLNLNYTLAKLTNNTDDINFRADDANNFRRDRGVSLNNRSHILSAIADFYPTEWLTFTVAGLFQSGQPINLVPNGDVFGTTDLNGDGLGARQQFTGNPDRYPGVRRNSERLEWSKTIDLGAVILVPLGASLGSAGADKIEVRADLFNVFNTNNQSGFFSDFTSSNQQQIGGSAPFEQRSAGQGRTFQFTVRYLF